jgi:hypothetical protein
MNTTESVPVFICSKGGREVLRCTVPLHEQGKRLAPILAEMAGLYVYDDNAIGIYNLTQDFEYNLDQSLIAEGTKSGDLLYIDIQAACFKH